MHDYWKNGPFIVYWNITNKCNFLCKHCHATSSQSKEMDSGDCLKIVDTLNAAGVGSIIVAGGEPLLKDNIFNIIHKIREKNIQCSMVTNGYYVTDEIAKKMVEEKIRDIQISVDFFEADRHDDFRGIQGSYNAAMNAIVICKKYGLNVSVNTVLTPNSIDTIEKLGDRLEQLYVTNWRITVNVPKGRGEEFYNDLHIEDEILIRKVLELKKRFPRVVIDDPLCVMFWGIDNHIAKQCSAAKILCAIEADGSVKPCVFYDESYGNVLSMDFKEIWKKMEKIRISEPQYVECLLCEEKEECMGGCKAYYKYFSLAKEIKGTCCLKCRK